MDCSLLGFWLDYLSTFNKMTCYCIRLTFLIRMKTGTSEYATGSVFKWSVSSQLVKMQRIRVFRTFSRKWSIYHVLSPGESRNI